MKMSTFLFGGLVGAGAVIYWNRRGKQAAFSAVSNQTSNMMNKVMDRGSRTERNTERAVERTASNGNHNSNQESSFGMDKVAEIVNKDPELKRHVDEIVQSQHHSSHKESPVFTQ